MRSSGNADALSRVFEEVESILSLEVNSLKKFESCNPSSLFGIAHDDLGWEIIAGLENLSLPSDEEWAQAQRLDMDWYVVIRWIEKEKLPNDASLVVKSSSSQITMQLMVSQEFCIECLLKIRMAKLKQGNMFQLDEES